MVTPFHDLTTGNVEKLDTNLHTAASFFVLCVGFSKEQALAFTTAYRREFSANWLSLQRVTCHVDSTVIAYVTRSELDSVLAEMQYVPAVIMLNEHVTYTKVAKRYIRKMHVPLIRVTAEPTIVAALDRDDYYHGVCATITVADLDKSEVVCPTLDYALLVSIRMNTDIIQRGKEISGSDTTAIPVEALDISSSVDVPEQDPVHDSALTKICSSFGRSKQLTVARVAILFFLFCAVVVR